MHGIEPLAAACFERTRSAVLNVLVVIGVGIAVGGLVLRWHRAPANWPLFEGARRAMLVSLFLILIASYLVRRIGASRSALRDPKTRARRFYRAHVLSAVIAALEVPLGLAYGWLVSPRLEAVAPFWVSALALGFLALPRRAELEGFDQPMPDLSEPSS